MTVEIAIFAVLWAGLFIGMLFFFKGAQEDDHEQ